VTKTIPETRAAKSPGPVRPDRRQNILDASQRLFANFGYHAVTIRQIAEAAQVPLALVGYYFGQKQELYDAIFGHLKGTFETRRQGLHKAIANPDGDALDNIIHAMIFPVIQARGTPEGESYALFVTRGLTQQSVEEDRAIREFFDPITAEYIDAIRNALLDEMPEITQAQAAWCFQFALGALLHYLSDQRIVRLSKNVNVAADPAVANQLKAFIVCGIRGAAHSFIASARNAQPAGATVNALPDESVLP
jgi:AcrR family transcriptional regulator